jgi:predicted MPP superfamily phosphohydrolase
MRRRHKFLIIAALLQIPLFAYPILRLCHWLGMDHWQTALVFLPLFFSQIIARLYLRHANSGFLFWLRRAADLWLGISLPLFLMVIASEIPVAIGWITGSAAAQGLIGLTLALVTYSVVNAYSPSVVTVQLTSRKLSHPLRFVQITDVHIGSRSPNFLARVMQQITEHKVDFVCITGDFIDAPNVSEKDLSALLSCPSPIYFSIGNHELYEDLEDIVQRLQRLGVRVLRSQTCVQGEVQLIGIDDSERANQVEQEIAGLKIDPERFVLLLYHRPRGLEAAANAGVDLMISGHTHNGQIVPFNFVVRRVFDRAVGLFSEGLTQLYVSPGTGTWGPIMRLGSRGEITLFEIQPS